MTKKIMFGAGCFWGVEALFAAVEGVEKTLVGYSGGEKDAPTYEEVCSGQTGHAEVIYLEYNEDIVSFDQLLEIFFTNHNPTTLNRQGPDMGTQYRSAIFYYDEKQKESAIEKIKALTQKNTFINPIVTEVLAAKEFFKAEEYHQKYLEKKGLTSCKI